MSSSFSTPRARASNSILKTPVKKMAAPEIVTESPGTWKHPRLAEIQRRRNANTFTEKNMRQVLLSGFAIGLLYAIQMFAAIYLNFDFLSKSTKSTFSMIFSCIYVLPLGNLAIALLPLVRPLDTMADIPLSNEQRQLLGVPLLPNPSQPAQVSTPPRYARSPSMASSAKPTFSGSPLSAARGSPLASNDYSPYSSPLQHKNSQYSLTAPNQSRALKNALMATSVSPNKGLSPGPMFNEMSSPSPAAKKSSVGLNSKWLYEKSRSQGNNW